MKRVLRLPSFIHVGPPRTGTTWLHQKLMGHVGLPIRKETRFFDLHYDRGVEWYCNAFGDCPPDVPLGEMGPTYFSNASARERIKHLIPDCKIVVTFREPAARLYSLYRLIRSGSRPVSDTFDEYWRFQLDSGADLCSYATHLKRWQAAFGKSRVLALFYEDLDSDPQDYLDSICSFIGAALHRAGSLDRRGELESLFGSDRSAHQCDWAAHLRRRPLGFPPRRAAVGSHSANVAGCGRCLGGSSPRTFRR